MVKKFLIALLFLYSLSLHSQEVLLPLQTGPVAMPDTKEVSQPVDLPFYDDFARPVTQPSVERWQPHGGVVLSPGTGVLPPTVGVATLDAIGADGRLYDGAASGRFAADTLCSRRIALDSLTASDSVVMSFFYLPGGGRGDLWRRIGDVPEPEDSLMLDFYRAADSTWVTVWSMEGTEVDSLVAHTGRDWQYVAIAITDTSFLNDDFAFRFRNYCSETTTSKPGLTGNCDFWHLDYILVDRDRSTLNEPEFRDVAFVASAPSLLSAYQAMPARQYRSSDMADSLGMIITNLYGSTLATQYYYAILDSIGDTLYRYDGGYENAPPFLPDGSYQPSPAHAAPVVGYAFPEGDTPAVYTVVHMVREGVGGDLHQDNDTVRFRQVFDNYFAYDDGTAENGYGLTSTASRVYLAYRFDLNVEDTLTALDLYFNRTLAGENEMVPFNIMVWCNDGGTPGTVLYRDGTSRHPVFAGLDEYSRYMLERPVVASGSIFVGFEQGNNYFINLGFDRSHDVSDRIYYLTGTVWQQSILSGALMIRPCFGSAATVGVAEWNEKSEQWKVFPNPASDYVSIEGLPVGNKVEIYDAMGRMMYSANNYRITVAHWPSDVYMVHCVTPQGMVGIKKLIIKH